VAVFHLRRQNVLVPGETSGISVQVGQERSRGVEFDLRLRPLHHWQSILGYTYDEAKVVRDTRPNMVGAQLLNAPRHAFNIWSRYDISSGGAGGLGFGIGLIWRGDRAGSFPDLSLSPVSNRVPLPGDPVPTPVLRLPSYFRADTGVYYVKGRYELTVKVNNVFDTGYYESAFNIIRIRPGNPRGAIMSARLRF
jgi:iron complex outermembrane receptor protein